MAFGRCVGNVYRCDMDNCQICYGGGLQWQVNARLNYCMQTIQQMFAEQWNQAQTFPMKGQSNYYFVDECGNLRYESYGSGNKQNMSLSTIAKKLFDADTKTLIKAGFLDQHSLTLTDAGRAQIWAILFEQNKAALVAAAQADIDEKKADK